MEQLAYVSAVISLVFSAAVWVMIFFQTYNHHPKAGKDERMTLSIEKATTIAPAVFVITLVVLYIVLGVIVGF